MTANPSYLVSDKTAFSVATQISKKWTPQVVKVAPLLAQIENGGLGWNKGFTVRGLSALTALVYTDISGFNTSTAGIADASEIPTSWPSFDATEGFSHAEWPFTHLRRSMTLTDSEMTLLRNAERGDILEGKSQQLMSKFKTIIGTWIAGNQAASRTQMQGIEHALNTANSVGGINQALAANEWWRATVTTSVGTLADTDINDAYDRILRNANWDGDSEAADIALLSFNGTSTNVYSRMRELIAPAERFQHQDFFVKYGIANFNYMGMKCVMENRMTAQTAALLSSNSWVYGGYSKPKPHERQRIPGSDAYEYMYSWWGFLGCKQINRNEWLSGISG